MNRQHGAGRAVRSRHGKWPTAKRRFWPWRGRRANPDIREPEESSHVTDLLQEGGSAEPRHLDLCVWLEGIRIATPDERDIPIADVIAPGVRWWDGLHAGDPRTGGKGIIPRAATSPTRRRADDCQSASAVRWK